MLGEEQFTTSVWNKVYKREAIFSDKSCFNEFEAGLKIGEDEKWLLSLFDNNSISVWFLNAQLYGWRIRDNSALKGTQGLTANRLDNIKTQEFVLDKAISMNDREFIKIARIKLYKEAFNICRECYKVSDSRGLKIVYPKLRGCRLDYYLSTLGSDSLKKVVWDILLWIKMGKT